MSLIVSDSGPIHYLILCGAIDIIPKLYGQLVVPAPVARELTHAQTPSQVRSWALTLPQWASLASARQTDPATQLGLGEREAIALACEMKATQLLVDDRLARRVAVQRGLSITGTVGILEKAAQKGLLELSEVLQKLVKTNFRIDPQVIRHALEREAVRRKSSGAQGAT